MANDCLPQAQTCTIRLSRLDASGAPVVGVGNAYVSDALAEIAISPVYTDGDEIEEKNACGTVAINFRAPDSFRRYDIRVGLVTPDPELIEIAVAGSLKLTATGARVGWGAPEIGPVPAGGIGLEWWTRRIDDGEQDATFPWAWWLAPRLRNIRLGDFVFNNGAVLPGFAGQAVQNPLWGDGSFNDWPTGSTRALQWIPADADDMPVAACGALAIPAPPP